MGREAKVSFLLLDVTRFVKRCLISRAGWILKDELLLEINAEPSAMLCEIYSMIVICQIFLSLTGEVHAFEALDSDPMLVKLIDAQCPVGGRVDLKLGAQVSLCT